ARRWRADSSFPMPINGNTSGYLREHDNAWHSVARARHASPLQPNPGAFTPNRHEPETIEEPAMSSLSHAIRILRCFSATEPELRLTEISARVGLSRSYTH